MRQPRVPVTMSPRALTRLGASPAKMEKSCLARSKWRYFTPADNTGVFRGADYGAAGRIDLGDDADNVRVDIKSNQVLLVMGVAR